MLVVIPVFLVVYRQQEIPKKRVVPGAGSYKAPDKINKVPKSEILASEEKPLAVAKEKPLAVAKEKPLAVAKEKPLAVAKEKPLAVAKEKPLAVAKEKPLAVAKEEPLAVAKEKPLGIAKEKPLGVTKEKPLGIAKEKPLGVTKEKSLGIAKEKPLGVTKATWDMFGRKGGYFHPFLSVEANYTDNVFNTNDSKESEITTIISPGIWLTLPRIKEKLSELATANITPGGITLSRFKTKFPRRYQTYLLYRADIEKFQKYSSEDTTNHKIEGLFQYNLRGGLSIDIIDQFIKSHDIRGTGIFFELDKFSTNLLGVTLTYDVSDKLLLRVDYSNYLVDYDAPRNDFRDRTDKTFSGYIFYKIRHKTAPFLEYKFIDINYNKDILFNNKEQYLFGGIQWDVTAKSKGRIKAGYGVKDFMSAEIDKSNEFAMEAQIDHKFTPKTSLKVIASRRTNETTISTTYFILTNNIRAEYLQRLTTKISSSISLSYTRDTYKGELTYGGETGEREDDIFTAALALEYEFKEWLKANLGYFHTRRNSDFSDFDYTNNTFFFRITGSL